MPLHNYMDMFKALPLCAALLFTGLYSVAATAQTVQTEGIAAPAYSIESSVAKENLLLDVVRTGQRLVVVGDRGHILYSDNEGKSWLQARVPTQQLLTAVHFVDDRHGWAVGHDTLILSTRDGGATWIRQYDNLEAESPLLDIWFKDLNQGYAVGAYGMLLETRNGGQEWHRIDEKLGNEDAFHLNAITAVGNAGIFIVGEMGVMFRSTDWGETWEALEEPYQGSLFGVVAGSESNTLVVYGLRGHVFRSTDFGESWEEVTVLNEGARLQFGLAGSAVSDKGDILIVGHGGSLLRSHDEGKSFEVFSRADRTSLSAVIDGKDGGLILVGQNGIYLTDEQGEDMLDKNKTGGHRNDN
ncbi:WD40/YVTN/BNR-like repeat-containing protein [Denitrificimonas halotolerans]